MLFVRQMESITWKDHVETWCGDKWTAVVTTDEETGRQYNTFPGKRAYYTVITVVLYFLPMVVMSCVYVIIIVTVWFSQSPGERLSKEVQSQSRVKRKVST